MRTGERGVASFYILLILVAVGFALMLTGGLSTKQPHRKTLTGGVKGTLAENTNKSGKRGLQLATLPFITTAPPPTNDCNNGAITGSPETTVVFAISPDPGQAVEKGQSFKVFYTDEWPLTLGSGSVSPIHTSPDHVSSPNIGDKSARDANNFPYFPALFLSDTTSDSSNKSGDAEQGGTPHPPDEVYGAWKPLGSPYGAGGIVNQNNTNLGPGADPWPAKSNVKFGSSRYQYNFGPQGYTAEIIWKADNLGLQSGHTYRAEFIIHDGDREGDIAEGCTAISY